ncbi:hypothetical protein CA12_09310 [Alienimonas californiensis]|uniref:Uncharacterized protein n=1 Tax=Alienimonas californiensis TaxID=2527989 RepID=A0A517P642_9PLAN|nr:hypothetical protein CA12_09310 [Alienimonas californiensis]
MGNMVVGFATLNYSCLPAKLPIPFFIAYFTNGTGF